MPSVCLSQVFFISYTFSILNTVPNVPQLVIVLYSYVKKRLNGAYFVFDF